MKVVSHLLFSLIVLFPLFSQAQNYSATTGEKCSAFSNKIGVFENAPYVTEDVVLTMNWLYCGPWNGNDSGHIYMDIFVDGGWQDLFDYIDNDNGCSYVVDFYTISADLWNSAVDASGGDVQIRGYITDSCSPGVGCSFYSDPCFEGEVNFDYEPLQAASSSFELSSVEVCVGETLTINDLSTGSSLDYDWDFGTDANPFSSTSEGSQEITYSSAGTKTVSLTVSNLLGDSTYELTVEVNPLPEISTSEDEEICWGESASLEVFGIGDVEWSNDLGSSLTIDVQPEETSKYFVTLTNIFSCSALDSIEVIVNQLPIVDAGDDVDLCQGESTVLVAQGEGSLEWDNDLGGALQPEVSPDNSTTYLLTATDDNMCVNTDEIVVNVFELPEANAGEDDVICAGESFELIAIGGAFYEWDNDLGEGQIHEVSPLETTTYSVVVSNEADCTSSDSVVITVNETPVANASDDTEVCSGSEIVISAEGGLSYTWDNDLGTGQSQSVQPVETTTYQVTVANEFNCTDTDEIVVTVLSLPEVSAGNDMEICFGESALLVGSGMGDLEWENDLEAGLEQSVSPEISTLYTLMSTGENGCENEDAVWVEVNDLPLANAGDDQDICLGESTLLMGSGGAEYTWDNGLGDGSTQEVSPLETTVYILSVESEDNCSAIDSVQVTVHSDPVLEITVDAEICPGENTTISVIGEGELEWDNGLGNAGTHIVSPEETTIYTVNATNEFGCVSSASTTIIVYPTVDVSLSGLSEEPYCNTDLNAYNMIGSPSGGTYSGNGVEGNQFNPADAGIGALEIIYSYVSEFSCEFESAVIVEVEACVFIEEYESEFVVYPNPVKNELIIEWNSNIDDVQKIEVYSVDGKFLMNFNELKNEQLLKLDFSGLETGNYLLLITGKGWTTIKSVLKD